MKTPSASRSGSPRLGLGAGALRFRARLFVSCSDRLIKTPLAVDKADMRHTGMRKSTPKVIDGDVRKKNNWSLSPDYYDAPTPRMVVIDRQRPGDGHKHILTKSDIHRFLELLPDWKELAVGLNAIVLSRAYDGYDGYHSPGVVAVCAWQVGLWRVMPRKYFDDHRNLFDRLQVECEPAGADEVLGKFDERAVRAYQLLHILLHELGHHHDRMTSRRQACTGRGEPYAEEYAIRYEAQIWDAYWNAFER